MKKQKETGTFTGHSRNLILLSLVKLFAITRIQTPVVKASVLGRLSTLFLLLSFDQNKLLFEYGVPSWSRFFSPLKMGQPLPLLLFFWSFQTNIITIFSTNICDKCPSSIQCWDSNPWPLEHESPPTTTRPGLPPVGHVYLLNGSMLSCATTNLTFNARIKAIRIRLRSHCSSSLPST